MATEHQRRFAAAAKQAHREGKKGKSFGKRVGEILRGQRGRSKASGTKHHVASTAHHGGGSTPKNKPKPRAGIYIGLALTALEALGSGGNPAGLPQNVLRTRSLAAIGDNVGAITNDGSKAVAVGTPAVVGTLASMAADWLGVNKRLARMRAPFRV